MAYRIEQNIAWRDMWDNLHTFLTEMTNIYDVNYESAQGDGVLSNLSVPTATATTETWTLVCTGGVYPQTFSMQGNITGNTAVVTVDAPYDNGIVKFTLTNGSIPWALNDIISFSTESTTVPVWESVSVNGKVPRRIGRVLQKSTGQYAQIRGGFVALDGPKSNSCAYIAIRTGNEATAGFAADETRCAIGPMLENSTDTAGHGSVWSVTLWTKQDSLLVVDKHEYNQYTYGYYYSQIVNAVGCPEYSGDRVGSFAIEGNATAYTFAVSHSDNYLYYHEYERLSFSTYDYNLANPASADEWQLVTFIINGNTVEAYVEDTYLGAQTGEYFIDCDSLVNGLLGNAPVSDLLVWDKRLELADIQSILASPDRPLEDGPDIEEAFTYEQDDLMPMLFVENTDNNGNPVAASFYPGNAPYFSYNISNGLRGLPYKGDISERELMYTFQEQSDNKRMPWNGGLSTNEYLLGGEPNHLIEKYWFIASNEFIIVAYKTYDPATQQQLPVYQIGYVGKGKTVEEFPYKVSIGTSSTGSDYWYTGSTTFRSGIFYSANASWLGDGGYKNPSLSYTGVRGGFLDQDNSYNIYPVFHYSTAGSFSEKFGEMFNIYGIQVTNVTAEDIVIIDGIRYIALTDTTRAGTDSLILVKLD